MHGRLQILSCRRRKEDSFFFLLGARVKGVAHGVESMGEKAGCMFPTCLNQSKVLGNKYNGVSKSGTSQDTREVQHLTTNAH